MYVPQLPGRLMFCSFLKRPVVDLSSFVVGKNHLSNHVFTSDNIWCSHLPILEGFILRNYECYQRSAHQIESSAKGDRIKQMLFPKVSSPQPVQATVLHPRVSLGRNQTQNGLTLRVRSWFFSLQNIPFLSWWLKVHFCCESFIGLSGQGVSWNVHVWVCECLKICKDHFCVRSGAFTSLRALAIFSKNWPQVPWIQRTFFPKSRDKQPPYEHISWLEPSTIFIFHHLKHPLYIPTVISQKNAFLGSQGPILQEPGECTIWNTIPPLLFQLSARSWVVTTCRGTWSSRWSGVSTP